MKIKKDDRYFFSKSISYEISLESPGWEIDSLHEMSKPVS